MRSPAVAWLDRGRLLGRLEQAYRVAAWSAALIEVDGECTQDQQRAFFAEDLAQRCLAAVVAEAMAAGVPVHQYREDVQCLAEALADVPAGWSPGGPVPDRRPVVVAATRDPLTAAFFGPGGAS